jgi:hypothetical protein
VTATPAPAPAAAAAGARPDVVEVLRAVDKAALLPLCPPQEARLLAGPVARATAGVPFTPEDTVAAARLLQAVAPTIGPALEMMGLTIPAPPDPVTPKATRSATGTAPILIHRRADGPIYLHPTPFAMREQIEAIPGRQRSRAHHRDGDHWTFPWTPATADSLLRTLAPYAPKVSAGVQALAAEHAAMLAARAVLSDDAAVPDYDGAGHVNMRLWTHQARFVEFGEKAAALCFAVKMGGGKTGATIALANRVGASRVLIVAPDKVRPVWARESRERSSIAWHVEDGTRPKRRGKGRVDLPQDERVARATFVLADCDCGAPVHAFVVNYEALSQPVWQRWAPPVQIDLLVFDEAHRLKNPVAKIKRKTKGMTKEDLAKRAARPHATYTMSGQAAVWRKRFAARAVGLTGTPFPQHPWDIFGLYRALDPGIFGESWSAFEEEFCEKDRGGKFPVRLKKDKIGEFAAKVMSIMYRPTVDLQLPPATDYVRVLELEDSARRHYDQLDTELWTDLTALLEQQRRGRLGQPALRDVGESDGAPVELTAANILSKMLRLQQLTGGTLRGDAVAGPDGRPVEGPAVRVSRVKAQALAEVMADVGCVAGRRDATGAPLAPEPVVVFTRFTPDLEAVREVVEAAGLRYAEISGRRNDGLDADARMNPDADVVGVNIQAGGTGIDLTRACTVVWYSIGYSVSGFDQAYARVLRPGQTRPVLNVHLQVADTMDEAIYTAIDQRRAAIAQVLRAGGATPEEVAALTPYLAHGELEAEVDPTRTHGDHGGARDGAGGAGAGAVALPWE